MNYKDIRGSIKSGDLLAWSHRGWSSWSDVKIQLVKFFTQSEYSHVGTAWVIGDRVFVIEAVKPLVRIYPLSKLGDFYFIPLPIKWNHVVEEYALSKVGYPYSEVEALLAFFKLDWKESTFECAELVAKIANLGGVDLGKEYIPSAIVRNALDFYKTTLRYIKGD